MKLYIGNKNYSSWSLRPWLVLNKFNVPYDEIKLALFSSEFYEALEGLSDTNKVPTLVDGDLTIHESLAIAEYINEVYCNGQAWPKDRAQRAKARALSAEMASSFSALRTALPMNIRASRKVQLEERVLKDVDRIDTIFQLASKSNSGWLFDSWSIADAMFAPVVLRCKTYNIAVSPIAQQYCDKVLACPILKQWIESALLETDILEEDEAGTDIK